MGWEVYHFGMEHLVPSIVDKLKNANDRTSNYIKRMPDFIVYQPETDTPFLLEVKFRKDGRYTYSSLKSNPYKPAFVIVVSPNSIKCLTVDEISRGAAINNKSSNHLINRDEFNFSPNDREVIDRFVEIIKEKEL